MDERQNPVLAIILGGGRGTRLFPLTQHRCKPAVPLAGTYRLVDIPISNCLNAGYNRIFVLTQFLTASLHRHIHASFQFDPFRPTVSLNVISLVASGCGYDGGHIEHRAAQ